MTDRRLRAAITVLAGIGLAIAAYLTYARYAGLEAFCLAGGGGCERVQSSPQSELGGVPVAVLGLAGYGTILAAAVGRGEPARLVAAFVAVAGFAFSAYLTHAELFVIHAICQWCVVSAALMTALAVLCAARLVRGDVA